jgi:hypothetical protein
MRVVVTMAAAVLLGGMVTLSFWRPFVLGQNGNVPLALGENAPPELGAEAKTAEAKAAAEVKAAEAAYGTQLSQIEELKR